MTQDSEIFTNFFKRNLLKISKDFKIDYIFRIEKIEKYNSNQKLKFSIKIKNKRNNTNKIFSLINDENLVFKEKLRYIIIEAIKRKYVQKDSTILFLFDNSISEEYNLGMIVLEVSKVVYRIAKFNLAEFLEQERILEKIIEIVEDIRNEGREGKKIGTLFIIGDETELSEFIKPLILNPFHGYPDQLIDILNNDLTETIKEYAQLDGCFIINNEGIIKSAGTYIDIDTKDIKRYYGWGTKHLAAVAITEKTKSIAILLSESGGKIKIFKSGKLILKY